MTAVTLVTVLAVLHASALLAYNRVSLVMTGSDLGSDNTSTVLQSPMLQSVLHVHMQGMCS